ncbi:unnamed protein product [Prorocentrum cordatum]|uniref:Uncharacterized protein n=2 Tax=Prorocentrum cordatum TaxID=2364126 RepID=A0ABN9RQI9_9DINO|nr:unnamed protein product [Polarella glacialis]
MLCTALYTASSRPRKGGAPRKEEKSRGGGKVRGLDRDRMSAPAPSRLKKRIGTPRGWRASSLRGPSRDAGRVPTRGARPRRDTSERPRGGRDAVSARARARMPGASCTAGARFTDQAGYCVLQAAAVLKLAPACPTSRGAESERKREKEREREEDDDGGHENQRGAALGERRAWGPLPRAVAPGRLKVQRRLQRPPGRQARAGQRPGLAVRAPLRPLGTIPFSNYSCIHSSCRGTCPT